MCHYREQLAQNYNDSYNTYISNIFIYIILFIPFMTHLSLFLYKRKNL